MNWLMDALMRDGYGGGEEGAQDGDWCEVYYSCALIRNAQSHGIWPTRDDVSIITIVRISEVYTLKSVMNIVESYVCNAEFLMSRVWPRTKFTKRGFPKTDKKSLTQESLVEQHVVL